MIVAAVTVAPGPFSNEFVQKLPPDGKMLKLIQNEEIIFLLIAAPSGPPQSISVSVVAQSLQLSWSPPLSEDTVQCTIEKHQNFLQTTINDVSNWSFCCLCHTHQCSTECPLTD